MTVFEIISSILLGPLKLLFEVVFSVAYNNLKNPGFAIIVLSVVMNILVLPLYKKADAIQTASRDTENRLRPVVNHIKKTFSGDERMMIMQAYYRQNNYHPLSMLSGSVSLLLEIPFFMAAYQFLSGITAFQGVPFGPINDLSIPDGLLSFGNVTINLLPIIMTLINVISSSLYLKGFPLKTKIQLYGMALFFLIFLYNSPAALLIYWTLNNTFSLAKTVFYRLKNPKMVMAIIFCITDVCLILSGNYGFMIIMGIVQLPWMLFSQKRHHREKKETVSNKNTLLLFICGALFLTVLVGFLIPSTYVSASPQEYIDTLQFYNPIWYVVNTLCLATGTFLLWMGVFYWLSSPFGKVVLSRVVWILSCVMLVNYMFFGTQLGVVSPDLVYTEGLKFSLSEHLLNICVILGMVPILYLVARKWSRKLTTVLLIGTITLVGMSTVNLIRIDKVAIETQTQIEQSQNEMPSFSLSKTGKNVVVIVLDRAIGPFVPFIMEEKPTLLEQYDGFTYYPNTISFGGHTNFGVPPLYGGYEYTPVEMNLRDNELLADKHNESLKVVPTLFSNEGYDVTLFNPAYAGYQWIPDLSIFDDIPGVSAYLTDGWFSDLESSAKTINDRTRNFFFFSIMKVLPVSMQAPIYNGGLYCSMNSDTGEETMSGISESFMNEYNTLKNMNSIATITQDDENTYTLIHSELTHQLIILQEPDYIPSSHVDNSAYHSEDGKIITANGKSYMLAEGSLSLNFYHVNMLSLMLLGDWFDYLRENDVYDNTRIIIVSDHGYSMGVFYEWETQEKNNIEYYLPMLLVKDFNAHGFTTSEEFMTNADVPSLSVSGLIDSPVNPYTGKEINTKAKTETDEQYVILSDAWDIGTNNGYQFLPSTWATVSGTATDRENWTMSSEKTVFPFALIK